MTPPANCTRCGFPLVRTATDPKERHQCPTCHHGIPLTDVEKRLKLDKKRLELDQLIDRLALETPKQPVHWPEQDLKKKNAEKRARRKAKGKYTREGNR